MKHTELHTWTLQYCKETFGESYVELQNEISLFKEHWPSPIVDSNRFGVVKISHSNERLVEGASKQFQHAVTRHDWWKEIL